MRKILVLILLIAFLAIASNIDTSQLPSKLERFFSINKTSVAYDIVEIINSERQRLNIPPVQLVNNSVAEFRAKDMASKGYYGHCDLEGRHPGFYYTLLGGVYAMEENVGMSINGGVEGLLDSVRDMLYNDSESMWLHRDSLVDPTNNMVDIGIAWNGSVYYVVIHMLKVWVEWNNSPSYDISTGKFEAHGRLLLPHSSVTSVIVYRADYNKARINCGSINKYVICTCKSYDIGEPVAGVVPHRGMYYPGLKTIVADKWDQYNGIFHIVFHYKPDEPGLYTIIVWAKNTLELKHPYDTKRYSSDIPILEYTFEVKEG